MKRSSEADPLTHVVVDRPATVQQADHVWRSWFVWTTAGETLGFTVPAAAAALTAHRSAWVTVPALLIAGAVEGALLGLAQATVLRRMLPGLRARRWVVATSAAAVLAWLIGLLPSVFGGQLTTWPAWLQIVVGGLGGTILLLSIGTAQWLVLRGHLPRAGRWIAITAGAWLAGLAAFMIVATPLWHEGQSTLLIATIGAVAGLMMAATVAAITGFGLVRLPRSREVASGT